MPYITAYKLKISEIHFSIAKLLEVRVQKIEWNYSFFFKKMKGKKGTTNSRADSVSS